MHFLLQNLFLQITVQCWSWGDDVKDDDCGHLTEIEVKSDSVTVVSGCEQFGLTDVILLVWQRGVSWVFYFLFPHLLPPDPYTCCVSTLTCDKHNRQRVPALPQLSSGGGTLSSTTAAFVSAWVRAESALLFPELSCSLFPSFCLCQSPCERCLCPVCLFILGSAQPPVSV